MQKTYNIDSSLFFNVAFLIFCLFGSDLLFCGISVISGSAIAGWVFPCSLAVSLALSLKSGNYKALGVFLAVCGLSLLANAITFDTTYDSISYHKPTVELLSGGWNPVYDNISEVSPWTIHYARAQELLSASLVSCGFAIETSKAFNLIVFIGVWCLLYSAIRTTFYYFTTRQCGIISAVLMLNPVVLSQLFTFYNDFFLYLEVISLISLFLLVLSKHRHKSLASLYWMLGAVTVLAINTKFTHFFFCGLVWFILFIYLVLKKNYKDLLPLLCVCCLAFIAGILIVGYSPYITNYIHYNDPFYPLLSNKVDIMTSNTPEFLRSDNRFTAFVKAQVSNPSDSWSVLKGDFSVSDLIQPSADSRTMGFGFFFFIIFLCSIILMILSKTSFKLWTWFLLALLPITFFSQSWWARYIPMPWATAAIAIIASYIGLANKKIIFFRRIIILLVIVSATIAFGRNTARRVYAHFHINGIESVINE